MRSRGNIFLSNKTNSATLLLQLHYNATLQAGYGWVGFFYGNPDALYLREGAQYPAANIHGDGFQQGSRHIHQAFDQCKQVFIIEALVYILYTLQRDCMIYLKLYYKIIAQQLLCRVNAVVAPEAEVFQMDTKHSVR